MTSRPLADKKIAVVVESQYIPREVRIYQQRFADFGATVELVSRLWGAPSQTFFSTVEIEDGQPTPLEFVTATVDLEAVEPDEYAAIIVAANYPSVRLRWIGDVVINSDNAVELARSAPAARFLRRAMGNPAIVKGLPCHALWLLTPSPETLAGRRVTCNQVVLSDVLNAGGVYTPTPPGTPLDQQIVTDGDLVTSTSWHASEALVDRIRDLILQLPGDLGVAGLQPPGLRATDRSVLKAIAARTAERMASMTFVPGTIPDLTVPTAEVASIMAAGHYDFDRLSADVSNKLGISGLTPAPSGSVCLFVVAHHGVWASELTLAMKAFEVAGYDVRIATLTGEAPIFLPASLNENFEDPSWGAGWVTSGEAELGWQIQTRLLQLEKDGKITALDGLIPARPQARAGLAAKDSYRQRLSAGLEMLIDVRCVVVPGGSGAIIDLADNSQLEAILEMAHTAGHPILTVCYGTLAALYAEDGAMMRGISHTIHNRADDFVTGTGALTDEGVRKLRGYVEAGDLTSFINDASVWTTFMRSPTTKAEVLGEAVGGPGAQVISPYTPDSCAVIDTSRVAMGKGAIITGRSIHCSYDGALATIAQQLGNEPLSSTVLMMTGNEKARAPGWDDYNANHRGGPRSATPAT